MQSDDTDAFDMVIGTDFLGRNPLVKMLSLRPPYSLHCHFDSGPFSVRLELSGRARWGSVPERNKKIGKTRQNIFLNS